MEDLREGLTQTEPRAGWPVYLTSSKSLNALIRQIRRLDISLVGCKVTLTGELRVESQYLCDSVVVVSKHHAGHLLLLWSSV